MKLFQLITIAIDSREQLPYQFENYPTVIEPLRVGDYSIVGLEDYISIERKELGDLISCLSYNRERFEKELYKSKAFDYFALVIEGSLLDLASGKYRSEMNPRSVIQSLMTFSVRYKLPVFFAETRAFGKMIVEGLLVKFAREIEKKMGSFLNPDKRA